MEKDSELEALFDLAVWTQVSEEDCLEHARFVKWYERQAQKSRFSIIKDGLKKLIKGQDSTLSALLIYQVFKSCWYAFLHQTNGDPIEQMRKDSEFANELVPDLAKEARHLADNIAFTPFVFNTAVATAIAAKQGVDMRLNEFFEQGPGKDHWQILLSALAESLEKGVAGNKSGPFYHRAHIGCLDYPTSIEAKNHPQTPSILLFDLVYTFRLFTGKGLAFREQSIMPTIGKPRYQLAADLINWTLGADWSDKTADSMLRQLLKKNPEIQRGKWEVIS